MVAEVIGTWGDNKNGESKKANSEFFDTDNDFKIYNFFNFCTRLLKKEH